MEWPDEWFRTPEEGPGEASLLSPYSGVDIVLVNQLSSRLFKRIDPVATRWAKASAAKEGVRPTLAALYKFYMDCAIAYYLAGLGLTSAQIDDMAMADIVMGAMTGLSESLRRHLAQDE